MRYFFQAGSFFELSRVELISVLESFGIKRDFLKNIGNDIFLLEKKDINPDLVKKIFNRLGGYIRYGEVIDDLDSFLTQFEDKKKVIFGISYLGGQRGDRSNIIKLSNDIKRYFKEVKTHSRFVIAKNTQLNEAQIRNNNILEEGFEFCIFESGEKKIYGRTLGIQDVVGFVHRDIDKPFTDYKMGVLPQKLARMMCNFTGINEGIIWDPFCGSGTVLMEASMLGFNILGSDSSDEALYNTDRNILWMKDEGLITGIKYNLFAFDVNDADKKIITDLKKTEISAVVCEPFMGSAQKRILSESKANTLLKEVESLYKSLFDILNRVTRKGFKIVLIIPSYKTFNGEKTINISKFAEKKWSVLNKGYSSEDLKWRRNNSIITRNIFILSKK